MRGSGPTEHEPPGVPSPGGHGDLLFSFPDIIIYNYIENDKHFFPKFFQLCVYEISMYPGTSAPPIPDITTNLSLSSNPILFPNRKSGRMMEWLVPVSIIYSIIIQFFSTGMCLYFLPTRTKYLFFTLLNELIGI